MNLKPIALLFLVAAGTGLAGFYAGLLRENGATRLPQGALLALDYLTSSDSFSEVESVRASLDGLAIRYANAAQALIAEDILHPSTPADARPTRAVPPLAAAIQMLEEVLPEFRGTGAEAQLLQPLLYALKRERRYDRWLEVYLDALYRHPTHRLVADLAGEALAISQATGRTDELNAALRHLEAIPLYALDKSRLVLALSGASSGAVAQTPDHDHSL